MVETQASPSGEDRELGLADVLGDELRYIRDYRQAVERGDADKVKKPQQGAKLEDLQHLLNKAGASALCLSGGGIRSATFNLGVIQGLAKLGLLRQFDYLSTVSGGGYVGSWVSSWAFRSGSLLKVEEALRSHAQPKLASRVEKDLPPPIQWLRNYSNYLAPKAGLMSVDTWTLFATFVRNLLIVWMVLVPILMLVLFAPRLLFHGLLSVDYTVATQESLTTAIALLSLLLLLIGEWNSYRYETDRNGKDSPMTYVWKVNLPYAIGAFGFGMAWAISPEPESWFDPVPRTLAGLIAGVTVIGVLSEWRRPEKITLGDLLLANGENIIACSVQAAVLLVAFIALYQLTSGVPSSQVHIVLYPVAALAAMGVGDLFYAAFLSRRATDEDRERWARSAAWFAILGFSWLALSGIALIAPELLRAAKAWIAPLHVANAIGAAVLGLVLARIGLSDRPKSGNHAMQGMWQPLLLPAAMTGFVLLTLTLLASLNRRLEDLLGPQAEFGDWRIGLTVALVLSLACALVIQGININRFSLHAMYRDRLIRAYLGATRQEAASSDDRFSTLPLRFRHFEHGDAYLRRWKNQGRKRTANPHTGFDDADNLDMFWLALAPSQPLWIVNMALNVLDSRERLSWQERKAASFTATPLHCGGWLTGYRDTWNYGGREGGISAGTAVAISGAAANPNMGYHSSPAMTFLMTVFNVRLGCWLGNPSAGARGNEKGRRLYREPSPRYGPIQLVKELFGMTNDRSDWIHLSDGGHFENLGLYEMCVRRCRHIVVCDASADPERKFEDLGNAIRKIRIDLGVQIEPLDGKLRRIGPRDTPQGIGYALFTIKYPGGSKQSKDPRDAKDQAQDELRGELLYLKPSVYDDDTKLPRDVAQYAATSKDFPHESTVDQFFSESQFESYRALGYHQLVKAALDGLAGAGATLSEAFAKARKNATPRA